MKEESKKAHTIEFEKMDVNGDKALSSDELHAGLTRGCLQDRYTQDEIQEMFGKLDVNEDGHVSLDEYLDYFIIQDFDKQVKEITNAVLEPFREDYCYESLREAHEGDRENLFQFDGYYYGIKEDSKCGACDKLSMLASPTTDTEVALLTLTLTALSSRRRAVF